MEHFLEGIALYMKPKREEEQIQIFSSELTYQSLKGALPSSKCSIKEPTKCKTSVYVFN